MPPPGCPDMQSNHASGIPGPTRPAGTALRVLLAHSTTATEYALPPPAATTLKVGNFSLDHGVVIGPGRFQAVGEYLDRLNTIALPDQKTRCRRAESADRPENTLHYA